MSAVRASLRAVTATAPAKVNLCLRVGPVRPDGFHPLATVYEAVGLVDRVTVREVPAAPVPVPVAVTVTGSRALPVDGVPTDESNIAVLASRLLARHGGVELGGGSGTGLAITIEKGIPVAGGMAGGSADAAATLLACDRLWDLRTPPDVLLELAGELGSDVPFALVGGTAIGSGRGELVAPLPAQGEHWWVVAESAAGLSTPAVYGEFDALHAGAAVTDPVIPAALLAALDSGDVAALGAALDNDLQPAAVRLRPELRDVLDGGRLPLVLGSVLSGSGPSCLFLCATRSDAEEVRGRLAAAGLGPLSVAPGPVAGARLEPAPVPVPAPAPAPAPASGEGG